jgi:hypothetical protein
MSRQTVGVFPASGGIGGGTVKHISTRLPAKNLTFIACSPEKLEEQRLSGATIRKADYDDTASLEHAFDGVDTLFLISYASVEHQHRSEVRYDSNNYHETRLTHVKQRHRIAIDCALKSGLKYIFYGSLGFAGSPESQDTVAHVMRAHINTEGYLQQLSEERPDFGYTVIREGLYTESYPLYTAFFDPQNPCSDIKIPHDGSAPGIAWVKREELGEGTSELIRRFLEDPTG